MSAVSASGAKPSTLNVPPACAKAPVPPTTGRSSLLWAAYMPAARIVPPGSFAVRFDANAQWRQRSDAGDRDARPDERTFRSSELRDRVAEIELRSLHVALARLVLRRTIDKDATAHGLRNEPNRHELRLGGPPAWTGTARRRVPRQAIARADLISSHRTRMTALDEPLAHPPLEARMGSVPCD